MITMIVVIKTKREATIRILLKLLQEIRYNNLYQELQRLKEIETK